MITLRIIQTRPALDVEFLPESLEYNATIDQFVAEGKIIEENDTLNEDQLTKTRLITFLDDETFLMFRHHPNVAPWIKQRKTYNREKSIFIDVDFI
jgi:hypothetical protein